MIRNYRQIAKTGSQVTLIGVGKAQGGRSQLGEPKIYINRIPIPIKPNHRHIAPMPYTSFTIEKN